MNFIRDTLEYIKQLFTWWVVIMPWERGIRIRFGKHQAVLLPGIWLKVPIMHVIYVQPVRLRVIETALQTASSKTGQVISIKMAMGYEITDIQALFNSIHQPDSTISNMALGISAEIIAEEEKPTPEQIQSKVFERLNLLQYGLRFDFVKVTNFAIVRTYRLMGDQHWFASDSSSSLEGSKRN